MGGICTSKCMHALQGVGGTEREAKQFWREKNCEKFSAQKTHRFVCWCEVLILSFLLCVLSLYCCSISQWCSTTVHACIYEYVCFICTTDMSSFGYVFVYVVIFFFHNLFLVFVQFIYLVLQSSKT